VRGGGDLPPIVGIRRPCIRLNSTDMWASVQCAWRDGNAPVAHSRFLDVDCWSTLNAVWAPRAGGRATGLAAAAGSLTGRFIITCTGDRPRVTWRQFGDGRINKVILYVGSGESRGRWGMPIDQPPHFKNEMGDAPISPLCSFNSQA